MRNYLRASCMGADGRRFPNAWGFYECDRCDARLKIFVSGKTENASEVEWAQHCAAGQESPTSRAGHHDLPVPAELASLLAEGRWPRNHAEENAQNLTPLAGRETLIAATGGDEGEHSRLFLHAPPWSTVAAEAAHNPFWTSAAADPAGLDHARALVIGDFGLGSDAPIVLDYRDPQRAPRVLRLRWASDGNRWVELAEDFPAFIRLFKL